jgi:hypothetical protein
MTSASGESAAGGIAGICNTKAEIIACYNTGDVLARINGSGALGAGGIVGQTAGSSSQSGSITACYNTGNVSSDSARIAASFKTSIGGISGNTSRGGVAITASYSKGTVSYTYLGEDNVGVIYIGGISGSNAYNSGDTAQSKYPVITACYWKATNEETGIGYNAQTTSSDSDGTVQFSGSAWPSTGGGGGQSSEWGTGGGSGSGQYWKNLGSWNGGSPDYPRLWFE